MPIKNEAKTTSPSSKITLPISAPRLHASKQLLLDVDGLSYAYGSEQVLRDVTFCVHSGEFIGLIGPNGAGKTTLLKLVMGLLRPTSGTVRASQATIAYVPQRGALYHGLVPLSVLDVVCLGSRGDRAAAVRALETAGLQALQQRRFTDLSGGQQQRVVIAKALASQAAILILDEPTTGIDDQSQAAFYELLQSLQAQGITIVMVSHEVDTVLRLVTRVICVNGGILYDGMPEHFEADEFLPRVYAAQHRQLHHHHEEGTDA